MRDPVSDKNLSSENAQTTGSSSQSDSHEIIPLVDLNAQMQELREEIDEAIAESLNRCDFILGAAVSEFEANFASWLGARYAIGVGTGLDAISLSLLACGIEPGDEVIVPANTFVATALAVNRTGATLVLIDCDRETYNLDLNQLEQAITPRTQAIIPVHLAGRPVDMLPLMKIATRHGLKVIEDAAQAHGAQIDGRSCGTFGEAGCFSFYPAKNLGGCGDGGMVVSDCLEVVERLRCLRNYGQQEKYNHVHVGTNSRLDTLQAAILNVKLRYLDDWNQRRRHMADRYRNQLNDCPGIRLQPDPSDRVHVYHLLIAETHRRDELIAGLHSESIMAGIHYPLPVHLQPMYNHLDYHKLDFPVAEHLAASIISLPLYPQITTAQVDRVCDRIKELLA